MGHPQNRKQRYQRRTEPRPQKFTKMGKFVRVVFKLGEETDRQTDRNALFVDAVVSSAPLNTAWPTV